MNTNVGSWSWQWRIVTMRLRLWSNVNPESHRQPRSYCRLWIDFWHKLMWRPAQLSNWWSSGPFPLNHHEQIMRSSSETSLGGLGAWNERNGEDILLYTPAVSPFSRTSPHTTEQASLGGCLKRQQRHRNLLSPSLMSDGEFSEPNQFESSFAYKIKSVE